MCIALHCSLLIKMFSLSRQLAILVLLANLYVFSALKDNSLCRPDETRVAVVSVREGAGQHLCVPAAFNCSSIVTGVPQRILVGFAQTAVTTETATECVRQCIQHNSKENADFQCLSVQFFLGEEQNCILNNENSRTQPELFVESDESTYFFEPQCSFHSPHHHQIALTEEQATTETALLSSPTVQLTSGSGCSLNTTALSIQSEIGQRTAPARICVPAKYECLPSVKAEPYYDLGFPGQTTIKVQSKLECLERCFFASRENSDFQCRSVHFLEIPDNNNYYDCTLNTGTKETSIQAFRVPSPNWREEAERNAMTTYMQLPCKFPRSARRPLPSKAPGPPPNGLVFRRLYQN